MIVSHLISHMQLTTSSWQPTACTAAVRGTVCLRAVLVVLDSVHELLLAGKQTTQRDLYYKVRAVQGPRHG